MSSFLSGAARTLDLFGLFNEYEIETDDRAMALDMLAVAGDFAATKEVIDMPCNGTKKGKKKGKGKGK